METRIGFIAEVIMNGFMLDKKIEDRKCIWMADLAVICRNHGLNLASFNNEVIDNLFAEGYDEIDAFTELLSEPEEKEDIEPWLVS